MLGKFLKYLRQNAIAFLALFIALSGTAYAANTVRSTDIVDGQVMYQDLAPKSVSSGKIQDNIIAGVDIKDGAVTGADVNESSLGKVPSASNSDNLGGTPAREFRPGTAMATQNVFNCAVTGQYRLCAPVSITVPADTYFKVSVAVSGSIFGSVNGQGLICAASEGPACLNSSPSGITFVAGQYSQVTGVGTAYFGPGVHTFGLALRADVAIANTNTTFITTSIRWHRYYAEFATP